MSSKNFGNLDWVSRLRSLDMPDWGNVDGTVPGRVSKMGVDGVVDEWVSEDDLVVEVGPSKGYTSCEIANISGCDVVGVDVPEAYSRGVADNEYGEGSNPQYVAGVTPIMPIQDSSVDGIVALNSVTYLCRNIGSMETGDENLRSGFVEDAAADVLRDFDRVTGENGYVILAEQTDQSYLVLQKDEEDWKVEDYNSHQHGNRKSLHRRYEPWVKNENAKFG